MLKVAEETPFPKMFFLMMAIGTPKDWQMQAAFLTNEGAKQNSEQRSPAVKPLEESRLGTILAILRKVLAWETKLISMRAVEHGGAT